MVVISLPHASLLHPVALRRPLGPHQSSFISAKRTRGGNPTLPAANVLSGVSPSGTILRSFPGQKPRLSKVLPNPIPHCKCSKRGFRFAAGHRALLDAETPLSTSEALRLRGWRLAGTAKPQPKNKAGAKDQPGRLGFAHHRDILNHQRAAIGGDYPQEDLIELLGGFNVNIHLGAVHISATNHIIRQQLVDR